MFDREIIQQVLELSKPAIWDASPGSTDHVAPESGELQLETDALTVSRHAQDTYTFQYQVIYFFFQNWSLWQQFDWCCLLSLQQGFKDYLIRAILLISGALLVFYPKC